MFLALPPAPALASLALGYWFVQDLEGAHAGRPIRTSPHPAAVLTLHIGRPNVSESGAAVPKASLLGLQSGVRSWFSGPDSYLVMVMLTPPGLAHLFPATGPESADRLLDLSALVGGRAVDALMRDLAGAWAPRRIAARLERWLLGRLEATKPPAELARFSAACDTLRQGARIDDAARVAEVSPRQLERWFQTHLGVGPKRLLGLQRVQASLHAVQTGRSDPLEGFSDQAHQVRTWRRHLGVTPGQYARSSASELAAYFTRDPNAGPEGFTHYL
ncbi:AraC family transcriptional regulator [Vitiosangium sp. GDMCC 1.1324]|uniref:helix-turn-helix domain-containing protein n=1 Tax=Vitiosangium sp. (strain GDMCC 1.1324) TaxID=2138576 RepID=UPI000D366C53|nr:helix-turn-helix domain-containing protein [Vitiosangium sp. GDMCC 1.1324]PTL79870.1 hypothetical protein DAT35_31010 [Vitiosangium sp. GDMCC 1.1324]